jgi:hypothetical protein
MPLQIFLTAMGAGLICSVCAAYELHGILDCVYLQSHFHVSAISSFSTE